MATRMVVHSGTNNQPFCGSYRTGHQPFRSNVEQHFLAVSCCNNALLEAMRAPLVSKRRIDCRGFGQKRIGRLGEDAAFVPKLQGKSKGPGFRRELLGQKRRGFRAEAISGIEEGAPVAQDESPDQQFHKHSDQRLHKHSDQQLHERLHPPEASTSGPPPNPQPFRPPPTPTYYVFQLTKLGIRFNEILDQVFKSELRKRLFVTVAIMFVVRGGYYIPLPGFDRRFHSRAMDLASGTMSPLGDLSAEVPWNIFQLGVGPEISASIIISFLSNVVPYLKVLKEEGPDGSEALKQEMKKWGHYLALIQAIFVAFSSRAHAMYYKTSPFSYYFWTVGLLLLGAKTLSYLSEKIGELGFGQGSSMIISLGILEGYRKFLHSVFVNLKARTLTLAQIGVWLGSVVIMTIGAAFLTQGVKKIPLKFYQLDEGVSGSSLHEVMQDQYVPILINPGGMQPIMIASMFLAAPKFIAEVTNGQAIAQLASLLDPMQHPVFFHALTFAVIFLCNLVDISDNPTELSKWLNQIGARVPQIRPGRQTVQYLRYVQTSARFWGGLLVGILAIVSTQIDAYFRQTMLGGETIGFTSMLILVGSIVQARRSVAAYQQLPKLQKVLDKFKLQGAVT